MILIKRILIKKTQCKDEILLFFTLFRMIFYCDFLKKICFFCRILWDFFLKLNEIFDIFFSKMNEIFM